MEVAVIGILLRIDKYLCDMGKGSRSQIKEGAKKGKLQINGVIEKKTDRKINPDTDLIVWEGRAVSYVVSEYYMLNKPSGVVSATKDNLHPTVLDLIPTKKRKDLFPVGRLDVDTEGLLLITNDGELAHNLLSPKNHVDKVYEAFVNGPLPEQIELQFQQGIILNDGTVSLPADLIILQTTNELVKVHLTLREGKFHQVKRMFEAIGSKVIFLKRIRMGSLVLDPQLDSGQARLLTSAEIQQLKEEKYADE